MAENLLRRIEFPNLDELINRRCLQPASSVKLPSFSKDLDNMLDGGFSIGKGIYEIVGLPGTGKTTLCLQLCVNTTLPSEINGLDSDALIIDCDGACFSERLVQMAEAASNHVQTRASRDPDFQESLSYYTSSHIMKHIFVIRVLSPPSLTQVLDGLGEYLKFNTKIKTIVVDSIAFPAKCSIHSSSEVLHFKWADQLTYLSNRFSTLVAVTNHVSTKFLKDGSAVDFVSLGSSWVDKISCRLIFDQIDSNNFWVHQLINKIETEFKRRDAKTKIRICSAGIRDPLKNNK